MDGFMYFKARLETPDPIIRRQAVEELWEMELDPEIEVLVAQRLEDGDRGVRDAAAQFVINHPSPEVLTYVASLICSEEIVVRNLAGDLLVKIGSPAIKFIAPYIHHDNHDVRKFAIDLLALLPEEAAYLAAEVSQHLNDPDANVVCAAIDALGAFKAEEYTDDLLNLYHQYEYVRPNVVSAISNFPHRAEVTFFKEALEDEDPVVQLTAAEALARLHDVKWLDLLIAQATKVNELAQPIVLKAIGDLVKETGEYSVIPHSLLPLYKQMAMDMDINFVKAAIEVLIHFPDEEVIDVLLSRIGIADELDLMIYQKLVNSHLNVLDSLLQNARDHQLAPNIVAQFIIGLISTYAQTDESILKSPAVENAVTYLNDNFYDFSGEVKTAVLDMCQAYQLPHYCQLIEKAIKDMDPIIQSHAIDIIQGITNEQLREEISRILEEDGINPKTLQQIRETQGKLC